MIDEEAAMKLLDKTTQRLTIKLKQPMDKGPVKLAVRRGYRWNIYNLFNSRSRTHRQTKPSRSTVSLVLERFGMTSLRN